MSEPSIITDALAIIEADPLLSAVSSLAVGATFVANGQPYRADALRADAAIIVASRTPPDDPTVIQLARTVAHHLAAYDAAVTALRYAQGFVGVGEHTEARDRALAGMRAAITSGGSHG